MQSILQTPVRFKTSEGSLPTRCLRTAHLVAFCWLLAGEAVNLFTMGSTTRVGHRLHLAGAGALLVSLAILSLVLPLNYVVARYEREQLAD